ncbi:hypothetical protein T01_8028 [Trichinella spiralis]|uniref:Uncharacterized protein n=1 Tax=Trichinella spiralis TaxID=6334 RepID=A0A0V1BBE0_TRISP|nr:hypothetical protein T01_8028 [Trichinella spiralis]
MTADIALGSERGLIVSLAIGCAELLYRGSSPWYEKKKSLTRCYFCRCVFTVKRLLHPYYLQCTLNLRSHIARQKHYVLIQNSLITGGVPNKAEFL